MAEVEIHHAHDHASDPLGRRVGVAVGIIGIVLSVVTIASHREHTAAVVHKTEANDQWAFYQAKKIKQHTLEVGAQVIAALGATGPRAEEALRRFEAERSRYAKEAEEIRKEAEVKDAESVHAEKRALRFDLGEGFLELGLVLTSLYFLARNRLFPGLGALAAIAGAIIGGTGFLL